MATRFLCTVEAGHHRAHGDGLLMVIVDVRQVDLKLRQVEACHLTGFQVQLLRRRQLIRRSRPEPLGVTGRASVPGISWPPLSLLASRPIQFWVVGLHQPWALCDIHHPCPIRWDSNRSPSCQHSKGAMPGMHDAT